MDNAGENVKLKARMESKDWKLPIKVEFTARNTPQQNSQAEVAFTTLTGRTKALFNAARIPTHLRHMLFPYAAQTATKLDGLTPITINGVTATRYRHQQGFEPEWTKYLHTWGEAGVVSLKEKKHPKVQDKGITMMFAGYPDNHAGDTFNMWDPATQRTHKTRDVRFLNRMYYSESPLLRAGEGGSLKSSTRSSDDEDSDEGSDGSEDDGDGDDPPILLPRDDDSVMSDDSDDEDEIAPAPNIRAGEGNTTRFGRTVRGIDRLTYDQRRTPRNEVQLVGAGLGGGFINTSELHVMKYDEAMATADCKEWDKAVEKEHDKMVVNHVFKATPIEEVP
ncbi:MAG: hypothetical protein ACRDCK_09620, partial [Plesiomonas shigelloides]